MSPGILAHCGEQRRVKRVTLRMSRRLMEWQRERVHEMTPSLVPPITITKSRPWLYFFWVRSWDREKCEEIGGLWAPQTLELEFGPSSAHSSQKQGSPESMWIACCSAGFSKIIDSVSIMWKSLGNEDLIHILVGSISSIQALSQSANKKHIWKKKKETTWKHQVGWLQKCVQRNCKLIFWRLV